MHMGLNTSDLQEHLYCSAFDLHLKMSNINDKPWLWGAPYSEFGIISLKKRKQIPPYPCRLNLLSLISSLCILSFTECRSRSPALLPGLLLSQWKSSQGNKSLQVHPECALCYPQNTEVVTLQMRGSCCVLLLLSPVGFSGEALPFQLGRNPAAHLEPALRLFIAHAPWGKCCCCIWDTSVLSLTLLAPVKALPLCLFIFLSSFPMSLLCASRQLLPYVCRFQNKENERTFSKWWD